MTTWFTSDNHFGHANIIKYCDRPFVHVDEMDEAMIERWNEVVALDDIIYHLGDFTLGNRLTARRYFFRLNGAMRVLSNPWHHDKRWLGGMYFSASGHEVDCVEPIIVLEYETPLILCHYPFANWDRAHHGSWHLHGHSHGKHKAKILDVGVDSHGEHVASRKILDVGVDCHNFYPVSLEEVTKIMEEKECKSFA